MKIFIFLLLIASASAISIECLYSSGYGWDVIGSAYVCFVTSMDFSDNKTHVTKIEGNHVNEMSHSNVKMIVFDPQICHKFNLQTIPRGLANFFPNMIGLSFGKCSIDFLNGDELDA